MNKTLSSLNDISYKFYENIYSNDSINELKKHQLKNLIKDYFDNIEEKYKLNSEKNIYYNENFKNKRTIQDELYNQYVNDRYMIYEKFLNDKKSIYNIHSLSSFKKIDFIHIPDIYTYNFEINKNFGINKYNKYKKENKADIDISEIEEIREEENTKCSKKKIEDCKKKDKMCNPKTGYCIKPKTLLPIPVINTKKENKADIDISEIEEINEEENTKCSKKKIEDCKKKDKICNPKTGYCIKPKILLTSLVINNKKQDDLESIKQEDTKKLEDTKQLEDIKPIVEKSDDINKCSEKKNKICEEKGKKCNPKTGYCIKK